MRMTELNPNIKNYLMRVFEQYQQGKLTRQEELSFLQDVLDSGLHVQMEADIRLKIRRLIEVNLLQEKGQK